MNLAILLLASAITVTYPNPKLTPGLIDPKVTQSNIQKTICVHGYTAKVRNVTAATKRKVFEEYGLDYDTQSGDYEVDHFISLEIGGLNDLKNLWPQLYCPDTGVAPKDKKCFGAREKDVVETSLHNRICKGEITLKEAQDIVKKDWFAEYKKIKGIK